MMDRICKHSGCKTIIGKRQRSNMCQSHLHTNGCNCKKCTKMAFTPPPPEQYRQPAALEVPWDDQ